MKPIAALVLLCACSAPSEPAKPEPAEPPPDLIEAPKPAPVVETVFVAASQLRLRPAPRSDTSSYSQLAINTKLRRVGEADGWLQVTAPDARSGWVHQDFVVPEQLTHQSVQRAFDNVTEPGERLTWAQRAAALQPREAAILEQLAVAYQAAGETDKAKAVRAVVIESAEGFERWFPQHHVELDAITESLSKAQDADTVAEVWHRAWTLTRETAEPLNVLYIDGESTETNAHTVIEQRIPWVLVDSYAEGTYMALELNPQPWQAAAKRTPEAWDDAFFSMVLLAYDNVSARGWSNWQQRNWDYGGCSPFGNGEDLHLRILLAAGPLRKQNGIDGAATAIWNDTLRDILQPDGAGEFPYCEGQGGMTSQAKLKAEADKILAQAPLSDAERELVMARITAGFPGDRPE